MSNEIVIFNDGDVNIEVQVNPEQETVWLTRNQLAELFGRDVKTIGKHINNAQNLRQPLLTGQLKAKPRHILQNTIILT